MTKVSTHKITRGGKALLLSYDFGLEHGPLDMSLRNVNPDYIFDLALEGKYTGIVVHAGIAQKYHKAAYKEVPLILKLNGKTSIPNMLRKSLDRFLRNYVGKKGFTDNFLGLLMSAFHGMYQYFAYSKYTQLRNR